MVQLALKLQVFNQYEEADTLVKQALEKSPGLPYVLRYAAKFYRKAGDIEKALKLLDKALQKSPDSAFLYHQKVTKGRYFNDQLQCHFTWGPQKENIDLDDMKQRLEDSIQTNVKYQARYYNHLAFVNCLQGNCEEAIQNLKEAKKILRENHEEEFDKRIIITYGNCAWVYYHMGQLTEAQSYLDKLETICKQFPDASRYTAMIPEVYGGKGCSLLKSAAQYYEDEKECFKKALEKDPDNVEWNVGYAIVLSRLKTFSGTPEKCEANQSDHGSHGAVSSKTTTIQSK
ncbi:hypothetical protein scyTo_0015404 [Scyliorhinus torazame]|uniref:Uncharacterized protein n=1 Tax=Scyliorhinus torazame TaxID=75743 RepID=A0A401PS89_SCYTO|nr:hypothetical protein [Scyliorhinus torazame]